MTAPLEGGTLPAPDRQGGAIENVAASNRLSSAAAGPLQAAWPFVCTNCGRPSPAGKPTYRCTTCGGIYDLVGPIPYAPSPTGSEVRGLARFRASFFLSEDAPWITLGEGGTPRVPALVDGRKVHFRVST
jgi:hypothetical protein